MGIVLEEDLQPNGTKKAKSPVEFYDHLTEFLMSGSLTQKLYLETEQIH